MDQIELPLETCHLGVPSGASKIFLSLWYVWRKLCSYLTLPPIGLKRDSTWPTSLTMPPNGLKRDSTWPTSPRSSIGCVQNDIRAYGTFCQIVHQSCIRIRKSTIGCVQNVSEPMVRLAQTVHLFYTDSNTATKQTESRFHMPTSPRSSIGCVQNDI